MALYSLNLALTTPNELFAVRDPDTNTLHLLERPAGGLRVSITA